MALENLFYSTFGPYSTLIRLFRSINAESLNFGQTSRLTLEIRSFKSNYT